MARPEVELVKDMIRGTRKLIKSNSKFYGKKIVKGSNYINKVLGKISPKMAEDKIKFGKKPGAGSKSHYAKLPSKIEIKLLELSS